MTHRKNCSHSLLDDFYTQDTWIRIYKDGSVTDAIEDGGAGSILYLTNGDTIDQPWLLVNTEHIMQ